MKRPTMRDIKKMFAEEHVTVIRSLFGTSYINPTTGQEIDEQRALEILNGNY